ncbi:MAG TPA: LptF/LptG family permease, partial [Planctomycetota bacterium]|nr:LptF/LptG family permease [Planctomycetota bacterium]
RAARPADRGARGRSRDAPAMMLFQRRLFMELLRNMLSTALLLLAVLMLVVSVQVVHGTDGLSLAFFARALPIQAAAQLDVILPVAVLVAVVLTYGRAAADNEIDTLRASGVHPVHVAVPGLVFGLLCAVVLLLGLDYAKPLARRLQLRIVRGEDIAAFVRNKLAAGEPVELEGGRTVLAADGFDEEGNALRLRVQLYDSEHNLETELTAEKAEIRADSERAEIEITFRDFETIRGPHFSGDEFILTRKLPREIKDLDERQLTTPQLLAWAERGRDPSRSFSARTALIETHMRLSNSAAALVFVLLGLPVALLWRRHDRTGAFLVAFLLALFLYYPSQQVSFALARKEALSPALAAWSGNVLLVLLSSGLMWRVFRR